MGSLNFETMISILESRIKEGESMSFSPAGRSMLPTIRDRLDTVTISPAVNLKKYDIILFRRKNNKIVLHRIVKVINSSEYMLCGDSQFMLEYPVNRSQVIGVVSSFTRKGRLVDCQNPSAAYKIYMHIWDKRLIIDKSLYYLKQGIKKIKKSKKL